MTIGIVILSILTDQRPVYNRPISNATGKNGPNGPELLRGSSESLFASNIKGIQGDLKIPVQGRLPADAPLTMQWKQAMD
jgi:hypothetical protein